MTYPLTAAQIAAEIADQVGELNHATLPADECPGLSGVADVCEVLDLLRVSSERLQRALVHSGAFLSRTASKTEAELTDGIVRACAYLKEAERLAAKLARALDHASVSLSC